MNIDPLRCTHLVIAFGQLNNCNELELSSDIQRSYQRKSKRLFDNYDGKGVFENMLELKKVNKKLKILFSVGGKWKKTDSLSHRFTNLVLFFFFNQDGITIPKHSKAWLQTKSTDQFSSTLRFHS